MRKPMIFFSREAESGNIFYILGMVQKAMRKQNRIDAFNSLRDRVFASGSYEEALRILREEVDLVCIDEEVEIISTED